MLQELLGFFSDTSLFCCCSVEGETGGEGRATVRASQLLISPEVTFPGSPAGAAAKIPAVHLPKHAMHLNHPDLSLGGQIVGAAVIWSNGFSLFPPFLLFF